MSRRILIVDDNRSMVETLRDILGLRGWTCDVAYSGEEALERVEADEPRVVLMDIKMEGMNGVDTFRALRRRHPDLKVVLMTAYSAAGLVEEARREGVLEVLNKPIDPRALDALLERAVDTKGRVVVLEDHPAFLETLATAVAQSGYLVERAGSLEEALAILEDAAPAVVLMDMILPGTEPAQSVAAIRRVSPTSLFILYSGHPPALEEAMAAIPDAWVCACLHKPFEIDELLGILDDCAH